MARQTLAERDTLAFEDYAYAELEKFHAHNAPGYADVWDSLALNTARERFQPTPTDTEEVDAWAGRWKTIRPWLTNEFITWMEEHAGITSRLTLSEWRVEAVKRRRMDGDYEGDYQDTPEFIIEQLESLRDSLKIRDELIVTAWERGQTMAQIQAATGLGRSQLSVIRGTHERALADTVRAAETATREAAELSERDALIDAGGTF
jgi:predicted XRE-type DNA-binding protein